MVDSNAPPTRPPRGPCVAAEGRCCAADLRQPMRRHPFIYEINTWVWLDALSRREGTPITLAGVPAREWDAVAGLGFDAVWLMGVWERSPAGVAIALENEGLVESFRR